MSESRTNIVKYGTLLMASLAVQLCKSGFPLLTRLYHAAIKNKVHTNQQIESKFELLEDVNEIFGRRWTGSHT